MDTFGAFQMDDDTRVCCVSAYRSGVKTNIFVFPLLVRAACCCNILCIVCCVSSCVVSMWVRAADEIIRRHDDDAYICLWSYDNHLALEDNRKLNTHTNTHNKSQLCVV